MGYEVTTGSMIGIKFALNIAQHTQAVFDFDPEEHNVNNWIEEQEEDMGIEDEEAAAVTAIYLAHKLGLDIDWDIDGEASETDAIYIGISIDGKDVRQISEVIRQVEAKLTPSVVQEFVNIFNSEPIIGSENYKAIFGRDPIVHATFDKQW